MSTQPAPRDPPDAQGLPHQPALSVERPRWPWLSLLPLALGAWAPIYAGQRARVGRWVMLGVAWSVIAIAGWIWAAGTNGNNGGAGGLIILAWVGAIATSFAIRSDYERRVGSPLLQATERAQHRLADRERARRLARQNPALAAEAGIGRPDLAGAADAGLVDVNNASLAALMKLPGVNDQLATEIVEGRAATGGFTSVEDMGSALDLPGDLVEGLRDVAIFLPRRSGGT